MKNLHTNIIDTESLLSHDTVVVGLSGGADSVCLTHALKYSKLSLNVVACHINHNLRGEESIRDMNFVKDFCTQHDIPLFIQDVDIKLLAKQSLCSEEECGRKVRYDFFDKTVRDLKSSANDKREIYIATAHTLSDTCETVIFNMTRGTALKGLCGIPKTRENIIRPIINFTRQDVEDYCQEHSLFYVVDSTNLTCDYNRNKIRHIVVSCLKGINSSFEQNVARMISTLSDDNDCLNTLALERFEENFSYSEKYLFCTELYNIHKSIKSRVIKIFLEHFDIPVSHKLIEDVLKMMQTQKSNSKIEVSKHKYIKLESNKLYIYHKSEVVDYFSQPLKDGIYESKTGIIYKIQTLETKQIKIINKVYKNLFDISLDCGKICGSIILRQRKNGDSIKIQNHTKTFKKLFNEKHISVEQRDRLFVLADDKGVVAVEGFGVDKRVECDNSTSKYINIKSDMTIM